MMEQEYRELAVSKFWGGDDDLGDYCRGAQVISYLKNELEGVEQSIEAYNESEDSPDGSLRKSLIEVINWVCDISENEDLRVEEEVVAMNRTTMGDVINKDAGVREVVEHCLSYFWDRLSDGGSDQWAEIEMLCEDIGTTDENLIDAFNKLGYEQE